MNIMLILVRAVDGIRNYIENLIMSKKEIISIFRKTTQWGFAVFTISFILYNISDLYTQHRTLKSIGLAGVVSILVFFIYYFDSAGSQKISSTQNELIIHNERRRLISFISISGVLVVWYIFIGENWETEKVEKVLGFILTWQSIALVTIFLFYPIIKSSLLNFLTNFANGQFSFRFGDFELSPRQLDATIEKAAENASAGFVGAEAIPGGENSIDLDQYPDSLRSIADRSKREGILEILPEAFLIFLFGQIEKILRILFFYHISEPPPRKMGGKHSIRHISRVLYSEGLIDEKFFGVFTDVIAIRNSVAHGD